jgi:V8-like Glu-specific endopeptidase
LGAIVATRFETTDAWEQHQNPDFDMAAIHLDEAILPERFTPFRVGVLPDDRLLSHSVNVSGYPGDKGGKEQWWARNGIRAVRPLRIFYDVDTMGGQSGAPALIIERVGEAPLVVGIHAYGVGGTPNEVPMEVNSAPRVTADVLKLIQGWVEEDTPGFAVLT